MIEEKPLALDALKAPGTAPLCTEALPSARVLHDLFMAAFGPEPEGFSAFIDRKKVTAKNLDGKWKRLELHDALGSGASMFVEVVNPKAKPIYLRVQFAATLEGYEIEGCDAAARKVIAGLSGCVFFEFEPP